MPDTDVLVSELTQASAIDTNDLMLMTQPDAESQTGYASRKGTVLQVATKVLKNTEYTTDLPDFTDKTIIGALKELKTDTKPVKSANGNPCSFTTDLADNLISVKANIAYNANGYSSANITRCGVNLLPKGESEIEYGITATANDDGTIKITGTATNDFWLQIFTTLPAGTYTISGCPSGGSASTYRLDARDFSNTVVDTGNGATFTTTETKTGYALIRIQSGYACPVDGLLFKPQIVKGSSALPYEPFNGQTYTIAFGQTVYGGYFDVTNGKLISTLNADGTEKATPDIYTLTPVQISALVGTNNITSDCGGDVEVRYADGQLASDIIDLVRLVINENA